MIEIPPHTVKTYDPHALAVNQRTDFTRRIPTGLSDKQMARDAKIAKQITVAWEKGATEKVIDIFRHKAKLLSNPRYWELMRTVWIAAGSTETAQMFRTMMKSQRPCRKWFMTPEDENALDRMLFPLTVWRAYDPRYEMEPGGDPGISWTLDKEWCENYADAKGRVIKKREVERDDVFAYISRRGEEEIIILDNHPQVTG